MRSIFIRVILIVGSTLLGLIVTEAALRFRELYTVTNQGQLYLFRPNPNGTGSHRLRPNLHERLQIGDAAFVIRTNSQGMAWREVPSKKQYGTLRIAFVGDSFTFGSWAESYKDSFVGRVDSHVRGISSSVEILNFGTGGYGFDDIELLLQEEVVKFSPDIVVLCSFNGNDFRDTFLGLDKYDVSAGTAQYHRDTFQNLPIEHRPPEDLLISVGAESPKQKFWSKGSAIARLISAFGARRKQLISTSVDEDFKPGHMFTDYTFWSRAPLPEIGEQAKDVALATLDRIHRHAKTLGIRLMIVTIPFREQVYSREISRPGYDIRFPQQHLRDFARSRQLPYYDLLPDLRIHVRSTHQDPYLWGDVHFNGSGHSLVGRSIAEWLVNELPDHLPRSGL